MNILRSLIAYGCVLGFIACVPLQEDPNADFGGVQRPVAENPNDGTSVSNYRIIYDDDGTRYVIDAQGRPVNDYCSILRLESGYRLLERGKKFLKSYYATRNQSELFFAWYSSEDSLFMARSVSKCPDKRNKHFYAARNLIHKNAIIQDRIIANARTPEYTQIGEVYLDEYRELFPLDIQ